MMPHERAPHVERITISPVSDTSIQTPLYRIDRIARCSVEGHSWVWLRHDARAQPAPIANAAVWIVKLRDGCGAVPENDDYHQRRRN